MGTRQFHPERYAVALLFALALSVSAQSWPRIEITPGSAATGELRFRELVANGANYVGFKAPASVSANKVWILPDADTAGCLTSDGSLNLSWGACGGVTLGTAQTISGQKTFGSSILPSGSVDVGANVTGFRWNNVHIESGLYMGSSQMIDSSRNIGNVNNFTAVGTVTGGTGTFSGALSTAASLAVGGTASANTLSASDRTVYAKEIYIGAFGSSPVKIVDTSRNATFAALTVSSCTGCGSSYLPLAGGTMTGNITMGPSTGAAVSILPPTRTSGLAAGHGSVGDATHPFANVTTGKLELIDRSNAIGVNTTFIHLQAQAATGSQYLDFVDTSGGNMLRLSRAFSGSTTNIATFDMDVIPSSSNTWDLGANGTQWDKVYGQVFYGNGNAGASLSVSCSAGQAVKTITSFGGIITAATCGTP
jgi:hypothetical protein